MRFARETSTAMAQRRNAGIKKELARSVRKDRAILEKHLKDKRSLFTGYSGPHEVVGLVCKELLKTKRKESNKMNQQRP